MDETTQTFEQKAAALAQLLRELETQYLELLVELAFPPRLPARAGEGAR